MRNVYLGDVGDFGKYGLLRQLCNDETRLSVGVNWYLMDAHEDNNDGKHDGYLKYSSEAKRSRYRNCDPDLFDKKMIRSEPQLHVRQIEQGGILPSGTVFYSESIPVFTGKISPAADRIATYSQRAIWHTAARDAFADSDVVFLDPDNGIEWTNAAERKTSRPSHKHAFWDEATSYGERGQSVVVYHHPGRSGKSHEQQIEEMLSRLNDEKRQGWIIHYRRGTSRVFLVLPTTTHRAKLWKASQRFAETWRDHASLCTHKDDPGLKELRK